MISFPFSVILIPYALALAFFAIFALLNIHHLVKYGATTALSFAATFLFLAGAVAVLYVTWLATADVDWARTISFAIPFVGGSLPTFQP